MNVDKLITIISHYLEDPTDPDPDFTELATSVDDPMYEDPAMVMSAYSEIMSTRVSYGGSELYDVFVAKVK